MPIHPRNVHPGTASGVNPGFGLFLLAVQVEVLDDLGLGLEAVPLNQGVVEVSAACTHAAHVQRDERTGDVAQVSHVLQLPDGDVAAGADLKRAQRRVALSRASGEGRPEYPGRLLRQVEQRQPAVGDLGGELKVLLAERGDVDRDSRPDRVVDQLEGLTQA
jgi:hypothetical protein